MRTGIWSLIVVSAGLACSEQAERRVVQDADASSYDARHHTDVDAAHGDASPADGGPCPSGVPCTPLDLDPFPVELDPACGRLRPQRDLVLYGPFAVGNQADWEALLADCGAVFHGPMPIIDWPRQEILGFGDLVYCPLASQPLGLLACGAQLEVHFWQKSDYCNCDYSTADIEVFLAPRGRFDSIVRVLHEETPCDQLACDCARGRVTGCDAQGSPCTTALRPETDGMPDAWPPPAACPSPPSEVAR